jgi:hypothetical protein
MNNIFSIRGLVFLAVFTVLALLSMQINFSALVGANNQFFTVFQFFGPIAGGFLGLWGIAVVLVAQLANFMIAGKEANLINIVRLLPMLFAVCYFSRNGISGLKDRLGIAVPLLAILAFWLHPVGQQAWYYALFWTIPIIVKFLPDRLFLRSLGATFTAHAVGGMFWVWTVPMTADQWTALLPVTAYERVLFALGITVSYVLFTNLLNAVDKVLNINNYITLEKRYVLQL